MTGIEKCLTLCQQVSQGYDSFALALHCRDAFVNMRTDRRWLHLFLTDNSTTSKRIPVGICVCFNTTTVYYVPLVPPVPSWPSVWERVDVTMRTSRSLHSQCSTPSPKRACRGRLSSQHRSRTTQSERRSGKIYGSKWNRTMISLVLSFSTFSFETRNLSQRGANEWSGLSCVSRHFAFCYVVARNSRHRRKTKPLWNFIVKVMNQLMRTNLFFVVTRTNLFAYHSSRFS